MPSIFLQFVFTSRLAPLIGFSVVFVATFMTGCGASSIGESRGCEVCTPGCAERECGDDGGGGTRTSCGTCTLPEVCQADFTCAVPNAALFFQDNIQAGSEPWGFTEIETENPIDNKLPPSDANGANVSKVADPAGGSGYALRHYVDLSGSKSARAQIGIWWPDNPEWHTNMASGDQVYIAQELYFPTEIVGTGNYPWLTIVGLALVDQNGENRLENSPTFLIARDFQSPPGNMYPIMEWGDQSNAEQMGTMPMPVGQWFDFEFSWRWSTTRDVTIQLWIDGVLALTSTGNVTAAAGLNRVETYWAHYGDTAGGTWTPSQPIVYRRNIRASKARITSTP